MKREYDFSRAEQGRFYRPVEKLEIPVYLDKEIETFFTKKAVVKKLTLGKLVNDILRKEIAILKHINP